MSLKRKRDMEDILKSRIIKFIIGSEKAEFTVHSMSIATLSEKFRSIVSFSQPGENEKIVTWSNVETSTFVNLVEYAYNKDYTIPQLARTGDISQATAQDMVAGPEIAKKKKIKSEHASSPAKVDIVKRKTNTNEVEAAISLHTWMLEISQGDESPQKSSAQYRFCQQHFSLNTPASDGAVTESSFATEAWLMDIQQHRLTDYETVFRTHTNLYILANKYNITDLKDLCYRKIRLTLLYAPTADQLFAALFHTIRIVYDNTIHNDPLRSLLAKYCISDMASIMSCKGDDRIAPLLKSVPSFAADLLLEIPHDYWVQIRDGGQA
ncbi:hypothetical protein CGRA01v4_08256 [Colletotrichum graminicola]|uniref:BTB domain-containing protein n=1 Tax=Colletotrichum graminicola (strain M1.001 / M2 / FGSC 10212) TaxID=645133 RepID=E3QMP2_COLGM|nr:uncharacterized protein GLRG_07274 [Colletotrichum graminicola M1.001]EFQ32130.1 hypothetical protein GLRG_07274 [Colletotrichum graminicola M1.001]WDK16973.1 hypothetical protein CGRA01v4_08256 [Colletotrichum graminicola]